MTRGCIAAHFNMTSLPMAIRPQPADMARLSANLSARDKKGLAGGADYMLRDSGYSKIQVSCLCGVSVCAASPGGGGDDDVARVGRCLCRERTP